MPQSRTSIFCTWSMWHIVVSHNCAHEACDILWWAIIVHMNHVTYCGKPSLCTWSMWHIAVSHHCAHEACDILWWAIIVHMKHLITNSQYCPAARKGELQIGEKLNQNAQHLGVIGLQRWNMGFAAKKRIPRRDNYCPLTRWRVSLSNDIFLLGWTIYRLMRVIYYLVTISS